jgi:hypothetical protein
MVRQALADVLLDRAAWTYARLDAARSLAIPQQEETITETLLLDIATALPDLKVQAFTRAKESRNGADWQWEWWFQGRQWFGLRVQAKRLKTLPKHGVGYDLDYVVSARRNPRRQVDLLVDEARADGVQAAYVLYNGPDLSHGYTWSCRQLPPSPAFFGVSLLPATVGRNLADAQTLDLATVSARSRPWSCLVSCDPFGGCHQPWPRDPPWPPYPPSISDDRELAASDLATWIARSYTRMILRARYGDEWGFQQEQALGRQARQLVTEQPPARVSDLIGDPSLADRLLPPRVRTLTIFTEDTRTAEVQGTQRVIY